MQKFNTTPINSGSGVKPIHLAASNGSIDAIQVLLSYGATVDDLDNNGQTPLFFSRDPETAKFLLSKGAKIDKKNNRGQTAADMAGRQDVKRFLQRREQ